MRVAKSAVVSLGLALLGCHEATGLSEQRGGAVLPSIALGAAISEPPCRIFATAGPLQAKELFYFTPPLPGADCGISWRMYNAPHGISSLWGYGFRNHDFALNHYPDDRRGSYFWVSLVAGVQNGPNVITFASPIDVFSSRTITIEDNDATILGPPQQRIVAFNDSGRVLVDTIGEAYTIISRPRMMVVQTYPLLKTPGADTTYVWRRYYEHAFRPDSSCPPSGDSLLDSKQVRDAFRQAMAASNPNGPAINKREQGGTIWKMQDGSFRAFPYADPGATLCGYDPGLLEPPPGAVGPRGYGYYHTHPVFAGESAAGACGSAGATFEPHRNGGGSVSDWSYADRFGAPVYAFTKDGFVYRLDSQTSVPARGRNPNRWQQSGPGCFRRIT
jgi:hypothetical protein